MNNNLNNNLSNPANNLTNKSSSVLFTGIAITGIALSNIGMLAVNKLFPLLDGSFFAKMLPGVEGEAKTLVTAVFSVVLAVFALAYLLLAFLGVNAIRLSKKPEKVKPRTGLAKLLIAVCVVSLGLTAFTFTEGATFMESFGLMIPEIAMISLVVCYILEVKSLKFAYGA